MFPALVENYLTPAVNIVLWNLHPVPLRERISNAYTLHYTVFAYVKIDIIDSQIVSSLHHIGHTNTSRRKCR